MIFATFLLFFVAIEGIAQDSSDLPKLREVKGKSLLKELHPLRHKRGMWGYADVEGKYVIKPVFTEACSFEGNLARVKVEDKWGTIGVNGLFVVTPIYEIMEPYSDDSLAVVRLNGKYGLIDDKGIVVQDFQSDTLAYADYGYQFSVNDKIGTIDTLGVTMLTPIFDDIVMMDKERCIEQVLMDGKWGLLKDGKDLLVLAFDEKIKFLQKGPENLPDLYVACQGDKMGVVTSYGQFVAPCIYDEITMSSSGQYYVTRLGDRYGAISLKMEVLVAPILEKKPFIGEDIFEVHDNGAFYAVNYRGAIPFEICGDTYEVFKPKEYESTTSIPEWSKRSIIERNVASWQTDVDRASQVVDIMAGYDYDVNKVKNDLSFPKDIAFELKAVSEEPYGIVVGDAFVRASGMVADSNSGYHNLHFKVSSGLDICVVSIPSTGEYLLTIEDKQFSINSTFKKFNVKKFTSAYPKDVALMPDGRVLVRFAFIRSASEKGESLVETEQYNLPVESYNFNLFEGTPNASVETHAAMLFCIDSLSALSFMQLPESSDYKMSVSKFGGFYTHAAGSFLVDNKNPLKRYDNKGFQDWTFVPKNGDQFYDMDETENYIYLVGSTKGSSLAGAEVPIIVQLDKRGAKVRTLIRDSENARFTGVFCKNHLLYLKTTNLKGRLVDENYYPYYVLESLGDQFGVRISCAWEQWGTGQIGGCGLQSSDGKWLYMPVITQNHFCNAYGWEFSGFEYDYLVIRHMGKYGLIDKRGDLLIEAKYDEMEILDNPEFVKVAYDGRYGVLDKFGKVIVPLEYDFVGKMCEDIIVVCKNGLYGCFDKTGTLIVPLEYDEIKEYAGEMARFRYKGRFGFIDKEGEILVAPFSDDVENFSEGCALVKIKNKFGFVTLQGDWITVPMYEAGGSFSGGLAYVSMHGKYGYIDKSGEFAIPMAYSAAKDFDVVYGLACVSINDKWGVIDRSGNIIIPIQFDKVTLCTDGYVFVQNGDKCGIFSSEGSELYPVICESIDLSNGYLFNHGVASARIDGWRVHIDYHGNVVYRYSMLTESETR